AYHLCSGGQIQCATSNISELKDAVTEYIEYYNSRRISLKLKGLTPIEYRNQTYMPRV
ncbi:IS3 family transposase, partial [Escherichia albertii]|nr:IS3 family transposase [Escherichia albertii]